MRERVGVRGAGGLGKTPHLARQNLRMLGCDSQPNLRDECKILLSAGGFMDIIITAETIERKIFLIRGQKVMLDIIWRNCMVSKLNSSRDRSEETLIASQRISCFNY
jgi:hypothetical protein